MSCNIFTYGSLMFPSVWEQVVRGRCRSVKAVLADHARFAITGETYPGMVMQSGATVDGILYFDVDAADVARLDAFEGVDYRRVAVQLRLVDGSELAAQTYLYNIPQRLLNLAWQAENFDIRRFLETYCPRS